MKIIIILSVFVCLLQSSLQISKIEGDCSKFNIGQDMDDCMSITCSEFTVDKIRCAVPMISCPDSKKFIYRTYDYTKVYPECCEQYLCE